MKIISFKEFAECPVGTIFSYYNPDAFYGLFRKGETIYDYDYGPIDYYQQCLEPRMSWNDKEIVLAEEQRWGEIYYAQQYAVYDTDDIAKIRKFLEPVAVT